MGIIRRICRQLGLCEKGILIDYAAIIFGAFLMALGIGVFLVDAKVVPGGVSGLSMALHYLSGDRIPVGLTIWALNVPLYIWGVRELGKTFGKRTFVGFTLNSFFIDFLRGAIPGFRHVRLQDNPAIVNLIETDFLFAVLVGAVLLGVGLGIIFKFRGSTAGSDIVAAIAQKRWGVKPGSAIMVVDFLVISIAGLVIHFKNLGVDRPALTLTLYAFFLLIVSSRLIDLILDGFDYAKSALVITAKTEDVSRLITEEMSRGATILEGHGLYTREKKQILYTVLSRKEISTLTQRVKQIDPHAFIIVNNVHEVLGEGFRPRF
ncbi:YitT family protein [candidate division KSB1 bacterium]|nr:YitT family protein [candidate division KSB1 bacterium]